MAVSVPKRLFKKAVDRNFLKRRIREAYRLNNKDLYREVQDRKGKLHLMIQYHHREIVNYQVIEDAVLLGLQKLVEKNKTQKSG